MDLDQAVTHKVSELLDKLESYLPKGWGVMAWVYNREGADLDVQTFASHESPAETLRIIRATASKLIAQDSRLGGTQERSFEQPVGGPPNQHLVSSATVTRMGGHDRVRIWSRGGLAGELVVGPDDGERLVKIMLMLEECL